MKIDDLKLKLIILQKEYFQYLYEQELKRAVSIVTGAKIYIAFLIFIFGSIFIKIITVEQIMNFLNNTSISNGFHLLGLIFIIGALISFILALTFTVFVVKVWNYDRLCNPITRFQQTLQMKNEFEVHSKCLCDYSIATARNNKINNKRAICLTWALAFLLLGSICSIISGTIINFTN